MAARPAGTLTAVGPERLDRIHLLNGVSSLYFEGATRYQGNLSSCVAEEANLLAQESGVSEIRPYRDEDGVELVADGPDASAAAFALTLAAGGQEVDLVDYVECRTLIPDEAVLIITLVTEPATFESELAAAQAVIDTIVLSAEQPVDPLMAYGGWLAAAQEQPSVAGPLSGELEFGPGTLAVERAGVDAPGPLCPGRVHQPPAGARSVGLRARFSRQRWRGAVAPGGRFRGNWFFKDGLGEVIASGTVVDVDTSAGGANTIEIVAAGDTGYFAFNERLVTQLDLSARCGRRRCLRRRRVLYRRRRRPMGRPAYSGFEVWSLAGIDPQADAGAGRRDRRKHLRRNHRSRRPLRLRWPGRNRVI